MPRETRAVLFDLDDTLYPLDRFVLSGLAAVAACLERDHGVTQGAALRVLLRAFRRNRGTELQQCVAHFALPSQLVASLVDVIRAHSPRLRLPEASRRMLVELRRRWRIAIVTNGVPGIQARKIAALGLESLVDTVVYAHQVGAGEGKPALAPFLEAGARLRIAPARTVFVGNDPATDVAGAAGAGMRTILMVADGLAATSWCGANATVHSVSEVPRVAQRLVD